MLKYLTLACSVFATIYYVEQFDLITMLCMGKNHLFENLKDDSFEIIYPF
jgi:hypothetical protein